MKYKYHCNTCGYTTTDDDKATVLERKAEHKRQRCPMVQARLKDGVPFWVREQLAYQDRKVTEEVVDTAIDYALRKPRDA